MEPTHPMRIRLEGRLEVLELAISRYAGVRALLKGNWERRAIEERSAVLEFLGHEDEVDAAIEQARRVADREGWPPDAQPRAVTRRLEALRLELRLAWSQDSWPAARSALRTVAQSARLPGPGEPVLLEGTAARALPLWALTLAPTLLAFGAFNWLVAAGVMVSSICLGLAVLPLGRYVLLVDRLVWIPYQGVPRELSIKGLNAQSVALTRRSVGVTVDSLKLPVVTSPVKLAALLELYRDGPLRGVDRHPSGTVMILRGERGTRQGTALIHPEGVCFLPDGAAAAALQKLVPMAAALPLSETFLLEQLTRLSPTALAPVLTQVAEVEGGFSAKVADLTVDPGTRSGQKLRIRTTGALLEIPIGAVDYEALRTLFPWAQDATRSVP